MSQPSDVQDREDMGRLVSRQDAALSALMERHGQKLFHYLIRCLQNEEEANDLAQEAFVRVYLNRAKFDPRHSFSTWLYTIATNLVRDRYRWRARHRQVSLDAETGDNEGRFGDHLPDLGSGPSESLEAAERAQAVRKAVAQLPHDLRTPLILAEYEEKSHAEIAAILDCSIKAVEMRIYRARNLLRESLKPVLHEE